MRKSSSANPVPTSTIAESISIVITFVKISVK
jgi:hypothetical protein